MPIWSRVAEIMGGPGSPALFAIVVLLVPFLKFHIALAT